MLEREDDRRFSALGNMVQCSTQRAIADAVKPVYGALCGSLGVQGLMEYVEQMIVAYTSYS